MNVEGSLSRRATTAPDLRPVLMRSPPFYLRFAYLISLWSFKGFIRAALGVQRLFSRSQKDSLQPEVKIYEIRPVLKNRVFRPQNLGDGKLPLYLDVHGGGWAVGDPETDDEFCAFMAQKFNILVVSLDYHKAPIYKFPCAVDDIMAIALAVIDDKSLNIDKTRVVLGGFSAGGNLAFAAAQTDSLRGKLSGILGFFPSLDLAEPIEEKLSRRPPHAPTDALKSSANFLAWAYVPEGTDLRDPLLSPRWANMKDFPSYAYLVGAEYDMLCFEAQQMADSLAKYSAADYERTGIPTLPDGHGWQQGGVRWECAMGEEHTFTHVVQYGKKERHRLKFSRALYDRVGNWLQQEVWSSLS